MPFLKAAARCEHNVASGLKALFPKPFCLMGLFPMPLELRPKTQCSGQSEVTQILGDLGSRPCGHWARQRCYKGFRVARAALTRAWLLVEQCHSMDWQP